MSIKLLGLIRRSYYVQHDNETVKTLFISLVRPHLEYDKIIIRKKYYSNRITNS